MKIRRTFFISVVVVAVIAFSVIYACRRDDGRGSTVFTDEDIFRGVILLQGDFVNVIPELKRANRVITETLKERIGVEAFDLATYTQKNTLQGMLETALKIDPMLISSFGKNVRTKDPQKITEAIQRASRLMYTAALLHYYKNSRSADSTERILDNLYVGNPEKLEKLAIKVVNPDIDSKNLGSYIVGILREQGLDIGKKSNPLEDKGDEVDVATFGFIAIALNIGAFVNIGMILNLVAMVNVEVAFVYHEAAAARRYTAIDVEFSSSQHRFDQERLVASIARRVD